MQMQTQDINANLALPLGDAEERARFVTAIGCGNRYLKLVVARQEAVKRHCSWRHTRPDGEAVPPSAVVLLFCLLLPLHVKSVSHSSHTHTLSAS